MWDRLEVEIFYEISHCSSQALALLLASSLAKNIAVDGSASNSEIFALKNVRVFFWLARKYVLWLVFWDCISEVGARSRTKLWSVFVIWTVDIEVSTSVWIKKLEFRQGMTRKCLWKRHNSFLPSPDTVKKKSCQWDATPINYEKTECKYTFVRKSLSSSLYGSAVAAKNVILIVNFDMSQLWFNFEQETVFSRKFI